MSTKLHTKSYSNNDKLFFLLNPNEDIAENDPVRVVDAIVENLDLRDFKKLYRERGRCAYHPKMMLKIVLYAYMYLLMPQDRASGSARYTLYLAGSPRAPRFRDHQPLP